MKRAEHDDLQLLEAFVKSTQYITRLKTQQDVLVHLGKFIAAYFPSKCVAFVQRDFNSEFSVQSCLLPKTFAQQNLLNGEVLATIKDVLESGFIASRVICIPEPSMAAFIPVSENNRTETVMLICHEGDGPLSNGLLNVYLAVAGLAGSTMERLRNERELNDNRANLEQLVKDRTADLQRSNKELEQFAYVASHDMQEPLRMISSFTGLLEKRYNNVFDKDAKDFMCLIVDGATRMQRLIDDLLEFSRVGRLNTTCGPVDCNLVFGHAVENLARAISETCASVTSDTLPVVNANETMMIQLFQNLIGNAIKFHRKGVAPQVHLSAMRENNEWRFSVKDNGIGIDPKHFERLFTIFQRLHLRREYSGTGIGLAVCKKIVEMYNGRIWIESQPAKGSTFYFTFPVS